MPEATSKDMEYLKLTSSLNFSFCSISHSIPGNEAVDSSNISSSSSSCSSSSSSSSSGASGGGSNGKEPLLYR